MSIPGDPNLPISLQSAFAWLATAPASDPTQELARLRQHLSQVAKASMLPAQRFTLLERFQSRLDDAAYGLKASLSAARLPLQFPVRQIALGLIDAHGVLATTLLLHLQEIRPRNERSAPEAKDALIGTTLRNLAEQQQVALMVATAPPVGLWIKAQSAFRLLDESPASTSAVIGEQIFKGMLALSAAQPESLTARQIAVLAGYLPFATAVEIAREPPLAGDGWFWLEESRDSAPVAITRRPAPVKGKLLFFSCTNLARIAAQHVLQLANDETTVARLLPSAASTAEYREVLAHAQPRWLSPPRRLLPRHSSQCRVDLCAGLDRLGHLLRQPPAKMGTAPMISQWLVLNESANGYAMMHVTGAIDDIIAGELVGVRHSPDTSWTICLLRWGRSDNAAHIEIGLELISPRAMAAQFAQKTETSATLASALLVTSPPAGDGSETLLVERGQMMGNQFTLIGEDAGKLRLSECKVQRLVLQTARIEMFAFKRDYSAH